MALWDLPDYIEHGSLGYDPSAEDYVPRQTYGAQDLWKLRQGMSEVLFPGGSEGEYSEFLEPEYDIGKEGLLRESFKEDYKGYQQGLADLLSSTRQTLKGARAKVGKAGFAGGGSAVRRANLLAKQYEPQTAAMREGFKKTKLGYVEDIYNKRRDYVDSLWGRYQDYLQYAEDPHDLTEEEWDQFAINWEHYDPSNY
jgi:hypothetical protein